MTVGPKRIQALRAAVEVDPDDVDLRVLLAKALSDAGRNTDAVRELTWLVEHGRGGPEIVLELARALVGIGRGGEARAHLARLADAGTMPPEGWKLQAALVGFGDEDLTVDEADESDADDEGNRGVEVGGRGPAPTAKYEDDDGIDHALEGRIGVTTTGEQGQAPDAGADPRLSAVADRLERPAIDFGDVGGMEALKEAIRVKIIYPSKNEELYRAYGKTAGGGMLMYGPPGCGKTHLARATAGEINATFLSVGVADVLEMWIGSSERNMRAIFDVARAHRPCVLFFDEIDALAANRSDFSSNTGRSVINQFLSEMDGVNGDNSGILVMGATNAPWHVDPAFRRPGRFGDVLFVPPPDAAARAAILGVQLRDRPTENIDINAVVARTDGYSGADLKGVIDRALEQKLTAALRDGQIRPITTNDLLDAIKHTTPTTREWFATVRNYVMYSNQSGLYDPVRAYLKT